MVLATGLFACYRADNANDPKAFVAGAACVLARYSEAVARAVVNPSSGLPSRSKWLPALSEIHDACEAAMAPAYAERRRHDRLRAIPLPATPHGPREAPAAIREFLARGSQPTAAHDDLDAHLENLASKYAAAPARLSAELIGRLRPGVAPPDG